MIRVNSKYNTILKTSEMFDKVNRFSESKEDSIKYKINREYDNFKQVILNRCINLNASYFYISYIYHLNWFVILLEDDKGYSEEYSTDYNLLPNTEVSLDVEQDIEDGKYILYIDITPIKNKE